jgi:hypothetical protein
LVSFVGLGVTPMYCLLEVVAMAEDHLVDMFVDQLPWIKVFVIQT